MVNVGGVGRSIGNCPWACEMAAWTSVAAASTLFDNANCRTKLEWPWPLFDVTSSSKARSFAGSDDLKATMRKAGVLGAPVVHLIEGK